MRGLCGFNFKVKVLKSVAKIFEVKKVLTKIHLQLSISKHSQAIKDRRFHLNSLTSWEIWNTYIQYSHCYSLQILTASVLNLVSMYSSYLIPLNSRTWKQLRTGEPGAQQQDESIFLSTQVTLPSALMAALFLLDTLKLRS